MRVRSGTLALRAGIPLLALFSGSKEARTLEVALSHHVKAQEVGGTRLGARAGHNGDDLARLDVASLLKEVLGALDKCLSRVDLGAADGRGAPKQVEAIDGDLDGAEGEDGRRGVIFRELTSRVSRLGKQRNAAQIKVVRGMKIGRAHV